MGPQQPFAVLVPYYSNLAYLRAALDSVMAQTDRRWWCVVVDDSPDGSGVVALVNCFADERITYSRNAENLGVAGNFNRCFELAIERCAELAVILHADDVLEPGYVAVMTAAHDRHLDAACVAPKVTVVDADGRPYLPLPDRVKAWLWPRSLDRLEGERGLQLLLRGQFFYCPAVSYRLTHVPPAAWDAQWKQVMDLQLYARLLLAGETIALEPRAVYRYRRHGESETQLNSATLERTIEETAAVRDLVGRARRLGWSSAARTGRMRATIRLQSLLQALNAARRGRLTVAARAVLLAVRV